MASTWCNTAAHVFGDAVPDDLAAAALSDSDVFAKSPNYWMSKDDITAASTSKSCCSVEACIKAIYRSCLKDRLPAAWQGAEWWVQVYEPGKGLKFHFDKDEKQFKEHHTMRHPHFSSILYLTGDYKDEFAEGPTVILQQLFNSTAGRPEPDSPSACILVWPCKRQFCVFDGALGHGVLESCSSAQRVTLLINWWTEGPPQGVNPLPTDKTVDFRNVEWTDDLEQVSPISCVTVPSMELPQPPTEPQLVDELLASKGHSSSGSSALRASSFVHPGYVLYPLEEEGQPRQQTMAAFVPAAMIEDEDEDSGGDSGEDSGEDT